MKNKKGAMYMEKTIRDSIIKMLYKISDKDKLKRIHRFVQFIYLKS